ncbi:MAG: DUF4159 domain-containing protein, partial [Verrucomicrobiota bacterium]
MSEAEEQQRLIEGFADGSLKPEEMEQVLELFDASGEFRERLMAATITERLLKAMGQGAVDSSRIMKAVKAEAGKSRTLVRERPGGTSLFFPIFGLFLLVLTFGGIFWWPRTEEREEPGSPETRAHPVEPIRSGEPPAETTAKAEPEPPVEPPRKVRAESPLYRAFPLDPPEVVRLRPPAGDGSGENGFVPPPPTWLTEKVRASVRPTLANGLRAPEPPLLMVKVNLGEKKRWAATPNDLNGLLDAIEDRLELRYRPGVKTVDEVSEDPARNPVLFITSHYHFVFTPEQRARLRRFMLSGGLIVFNAGLGSKPAYDSARRELLYIFPELPIQGLGEDHALFHAFYDFSREDRPQLEGLTLSCRTAAVISPKGLAAGWANKSYEDYKHHNAYDPETATRLGVNLFSYAMAARAWLKRASLTSAFADPSAAEAGKMFVAQVQHRGIWRTRHAALPFLLQTFNQRTEVPVKFRVRTVTLTEPDLFNAPMLYLTGHEPLLLDQEEMKGLRNYLKNGGFLFAEACCGRRSFDRSFRAVIQEVYPEGQLEKISADSQLFHQPNRVELLGATPSLGAKTKSMLIPPRLEGVKTGAYYGVIYSPFGLAGG